MIAYAPEIAATITAGMSSLGVSSPGRRQEDDHNIVATLTARYAKGSDSDASDASDAIIVQPIAVHENQRGEITTRDTIGLTTGGGKPGQGYPVVAFSHTAGIDQQVSTTVTPTMKAGHDTMPSVHDGTIVRRLTPMECERLQGFPDGWTEGQSDAQRYRQMGNAVAVPVVEWIARRLIAVDGEVMA